MWGHVEPRSVHLFPELTSGLAKEFILPTHVIMDKQTAILTDETIGNDTLYNTVVHLDTGALVKLGGCKFVSIWIWCRQRSVYHYQAVPEASNKARGASEQIIQSHRS